MAGGCIVPDDAPSYERKGGEPREQAAEPRESIRAEEQMHWVREEFRGRLQQMVQLRADKPGGQGKRSGLRHRRNFWLRYHGEPSRRAARNMR